MNVIFSYQKKAFFYPSRNLFFRYASDAVWALHVPRTTPCFYRIFLRNTNNNSVMEYEQDTFDFETMQHSCSTTSTTPSLSSLLATKRMTRSASTRFSHTLNESSFCFGETLVSGTPSICNVTDCNSTFSMSHSSGDSSMRRQASFISVPLNADDCHPLSFKEEEDEWISPPKKAEAFKKFSLSSSLSKLTLSLTNLTSRYETTFAVSAQDFSTGVMHEEFQLVPLDTFRVVNTPQDADEPFKVQHRELRINWRFLRLYAHDYNTKMQRLLSVSEEDIDRFEEEAEESGCVPDNDVLRDYGRGRSRTRNTIGRQQDLFLGLKAREKLWSNVILPPREDLPLQNSLKKAHFIRARQDLHPSATPWQGFGQCHQQSKLKPYGHLQNNIQYTRKGWCHDRWISIN